MAPFWDGIDIRSAGSISYGIFESDSYYLEQVNVYIRRERQNIFQGTWMMNVYYKEVGLLIEESIDDPFFEPTEIVIKVIILI